jgi:homoaconitase/3-isopropylmalate dehydratase large subunit
MSVSTSNTAIRPTVVKITVDVPAEKREHFHRLWEQILSDEDAPINQQVNADDNTRESVMKNGKEALFRLYEVTQRGTGQSRVVAVFLASLYNGRAFSFDLTDLRVLDEKLFEDCMVVLRMDARHCIHEIHNYFEDGDRRWKEMISEWNLTDRSNY